jgi:hypothetical protein
MIIKLEPTQITQQCSGRFEDGEPCTAVNTIPFAFLLLGQADLPYLEVGDLDSGIRIYAKKTGMSLALLNTKTSATLSSVLAGNVLTVTLADDGTDPTTLRSALKTEIETKAGASFAVRNYGSDGAAAEMPLTALGYTASARMNKNLILLPTCSTCGSTEQLLRDFTVIPPAYAGTPNGRLKLAVNFLATQLKGAGQVHYKCEAALAAETSSPPSQLPGWPPGGFFLIDP